MYCSQFTVQVSAQSYISNLLKINRLNNFTVILIEPPLLS